MFESIPIMTRLYTMAQLIDNERPDDGRTILDVQLPEVSIIYPAKGHT